MPPRRGWDRMLSAMVTFPASRDWSIIAVVFCGYALFALCLGFFSGFLQWQPASKPWLPIMLKTFWLPAFIEEMGFRVLILPGPLKDFSPSHRGWIGLSLFLFVIYHPLNAVIFYPAGYPVFLTPLFLTMAGGLGIASTVLYYRTRSIWPSVILHWLVVVTWLCCLGGVGSLTDD